MRLMVEANIIARLHRHREPQRGVAARDEEVPERPRGRHDARSGSTRIQDAGHRGLVRHDPGLRPRRRRRSSTPSAEFLDEARIAMRHDRHARRAIPKTPLHARLAARGPARPGRRAGVRHQRHPAADEPRGAARRLRPADGRGLRAGGLPGPAGQPLPRGRLRHRPGAPAAAALAAPSPPTRRCSPRRRWSWPACCGGCRSRPCAGSTRGAAGGSPGRAATRSCSWPTRCGAPCTTTSASWPGASPAARSSTRSDPAARALPHHPMIRLRRRRAPGAARARTR